MAGTAKDQGVSGPLKAGMLERSGLAMDSVRTWLTRFWKIGLLMAKGAYLIGERRRLFLRLGEEVYYKICKGELRHAELESVVHQLDRLTKKIEIEEMLIRNLRFGTSRTVRSNQIPSEGNT
ncbi:MAG: hypothetical protein HY537_14265 [Deltaproteobacteria bacterium]|nr:hypothetical protein [Deltaproteobacteria bacterium]